MKSMNSKTDGELLKELIEIRKLIPNSLDLRLQMMEDEVMKTGIHIAHIETLRDKVKELQERMKTI